MKKKVNMTSCTDWCSRLFFAIFMAASASLSAQTGDSGRAGISSLEQTFYNSGKVWVVVTVAGVILLGIFVYMFRIDRNLARLEGEVRKQLSKK